MSGQDAPALSFPEVAYNDHRQRQIADRLPVAAAVVVVVSFFYALGELIQRPAHFEEVLVPNCLQLAIPLAAWWLGRGRWRRHAERLALVADLAFTVTLLSQLFLPSNTTSGTALFVSVKMLATALLFPWSARVQYLSAGVTLLLYWGALSVSGRHIDSAALLHQVLGPMIAALLSAAGATGAERARRALFVRDRQLEASAARFRALVENAFETVWLLDRDGVVLYLSPNGRRIFGEGAQAVIGRSGFEGVHADDLERARSLLRTVLDNPGMPVTDRVRWRHPDGSWRWIEATACNLLHNPDVRAIVANSRDITRRQAAEDALRRSERYFRSVIEHAQDLIAIIDPDGTMRYASPSFERILGHKPEEFIGKKGFDFIHPADLPAVMDTVARVIQNADSTISVEYRFRHHDGSWRTLESLGRNLLDDPAVAGLVVNSRDVTERRRAEAEIQHLNAALEQRVRERTAQLEATNKELEAFAYSVSHDLRAPLRAIQGFSTMLLEDHARALDPEGRRHLDRVVAATARMGQLIDDLLELSRVTRGEMHRQAVDLSALALGVAADLQRTQPQRQVEFVIPPGLVADADARLLRIALENLLGNAWKYTSKHATGRIEFGTINQVTGVGCQVSGAESGARPVSSAQPPVSSETIFFVRDDGAGFDPAYAGKLFGAFQRLHAASEFEGTGIGLATVQRVIHRHGGRTWAEGGVEQGATFYFTLPQ